MWKQFLCFFVLTTLLLLPVVLSTSETNMTTDTTMPTPITTTITTVTTTTTFIESDTMFIAKRVIEKSRDIFDGYSFYHYLAEFKDEEPEWHWYIMWMDDVFFMHTGLYDFEFLAKALDTYAEATMKEEYPHTPVMLNVSGLESCDFRNYGALYFNMMVYTFVKTTNDFNKSLDWKDSVLKNHEYIKNNHMESGVYYESSLVNLQPDYVLKSGYITDMTIYYLASLRTLNYVYGIDTNEEFSNVTDALIEKMWSDERGFFVDWVDPEGNYHFHFGTEQLWGVVFDLLPYQIQLKMSESLNKTKEMCGRFWQYAPYEYLTEYTCLDPAWNNALKICEAMLYLKTLMKFSYNSSFINQEIERYERAILSEGEYVGNFVDFYSMNEDGELVKDGCCNFIMNAGAWLAIKNCSELSFSAIPEFSNWTVLSGILLCLLVCVMILLTTTSSKDREHIGKYEIGCPKHGKHVNYSSGYPPYEKVRCPVKGCTWWQYVR